MVRLDGKEVARKKKEQTAQRALDFSQKFGRPPGLAVVLVGEDPASQVYVGSKVKTCKALGIESFRRDFPASCSPDEVIQHLQELNENEAVDGILVQLPLPSGHDEQRVLESIHPEKDADGLSYLSLGYLWAGKGRVSPCTPAGVMAILEHYDISVSGKKVVVVGRSHMVGKPMAQLLMDANGTVTICHSRTPSVAEFTRNADIVVVAAGQPHLLGKDDFKKDSVIVDVGIHRDDQNPKKLFGDVRFSELDGHVAFATPVPGGVGPMTIAMLMENTVSLAFHRKEKD